MKSDYKVPKQSKKEAQKFALLNRKIHSAQKWLLEHVDSCTTLEFNLCSEKIKNLRTEAKALNSKYRRKRIVN